MFERGTKKPAKQHPSYRLTHTPNDEQTSVEFWEMYLANLFTHNNAYAEKHIDRGRIVELVPFATGNSKTIRDRGRLFVEHCTSDGKTVTLPIENVFRVHGIGDHLNGASYIDAAQRSLQLAQTLEDSALEDMRDGVRPDYIITIPPEKLLERIQQIDADSIKEDKATIQRQIEGAKTRRGMFLPDGYSVTPYSANYQTSQFIENRAFQTSELARVWNVPLFKLDTSIEPTEMRRIEWQERVVKVVTKIEKRLERDLLSEADRDSYQFKFNTSALLRADSKSQAERYVKLWQVGAYTTNRILELEDEPAHNDPRADAPNFPVNMTTEQISGAQQFTNPADGGIAGEPAEPQARQRQDRASQPLSEPQKRSLSGRKQAAKGSKQAFKEATERIIRKEKASVLKDAKSILANRTPENLIDRLRELYTGDLRAFIEAQFKAPSERLFAEIVANMTKELGKQFTPAELDRTLRNFLENLATDYAARSLGQLSNIINDPEISTENVLPALEERFDEWENGRTEANASRAEKVAERQSSSGSNGFARILYGLAGVSVLRWVTSSPCEFCEPFDGATFGVDSDHPSPPLHSACSCDITSG
jgi:HK97 family phage portal protein